MRRQAQLVRAFGLGVVVSLVSAGCAAGLAADPKFATDSDAKPQGQPPSSSQNAAPPPIDAPKNDLTWEDCTRQTFTAANVPPISGISLQCARYDADLDPISGANGTISIGVVKATSTATPSDAGPVVMTTGTDLPSSVQLPVWLSRNGADILKTNPIVAVDRRGMGTSGALDCRDSFDRQEMADQAQFEPGDDPVAKLFAISQTATTGCTDTIAPGDSSYDNVRAAEDLERLRSTWDVPRLALVGIGNGSQIALAYAGSHPNKVSRLVLDSPLPLAVGAEAATEQRVKGQQAALDAFATQCAASACALGPDPKGAVSAMLADARAGRGPGGVSVSALADGIATALAFPVGDRVAATAELAQTLSAIRGGDMGALNALLTRAEDLRLTDGQFVNSCSDALNRPTPDRVRELVVAWGKLYPQFGTVAALSMVDCLNWPSGTQAQEPRTLDIPAMLLGVQNDPIVGNEGVAAVAAAILNAGAMNRRVIWQGVGHGAVVYSPCAMAPVLGYLATGKIPDNDTYCPA
jgi:pimeloyl-ACP methyl ester carboxylesterase